MRSYGSLHKGGCMSDRPDFRLDDLITFEAVQKMLSAHAHVTGMQVTIVDAFDARVLAGAGWQDICTHFHRSHPVSLKRCVQSDTSFLRNMREIKVHEYTCLNGLQHVGIPIIVDATHLGTLFLGQFFYEHLGKDRAFFIRQAQELGFDLGQYLEALERVPVFSRQRVQDILEYNLAFASFIAELAMKNRALRQEVEERKRAEDHRQKLEMQLRQAEKLEAIGVLAGGVAHEFNNILQGIKGNIELWQRKVDPADPDVKYLRSMDALTNRASDLVQGLLTFSRSQESYELAPVDVHQVIASTLRRLKETVPPSIRVETRLEARRTTVIGNFAQLQQVLMNLASNSVDALCDAGTSGTIGFATSNTPLDEPGSGGLVAEEVVSLQVWDTGPGMNQATRDHVFEPFFTTKEVGAGTGLGLATAHGIVQTHQGRISCATAQGQGTTFTLSFPVCGETGQPAEKIETVTDSGPEPWSGEGRVQRILFVDDEEVVLEVIKEWLEEIGYRVVTSQSGEEALEVFRSGKGAFDLVILDLGMPGLGGEATLKAMLEHDPEAKILVASGYQRHPISENPQQYGAAGFLGKPFRFEALHSSIVNSLG